MTLRSINPATGEAVFTGPAATAAEVGAAVANARSAFNSWQRTSLEHRADLLRKFAALVIERKQELAELISRETGKPLWESLAEADLVAGKVGNSFEAHKDRRIPTPGPIGTTAAATRYKPHGVVAVLGPFNMPAHLPNGHIVPALLAGNTVVFKPSELAPGVGEALVRLYLDAGLPEGVVKLVQGGRETGATLIGNGEIDGVFFTGSLSGGTAISRARADRPGVITALEMGGNNPLVIWDIDDLDAAAHWTIQSAFVTAGQRCTCARRLIVHESAHALLGRIVDAARSIRVGPYTARPEPFMGPVISAGAASHILAARQGLLDAGGMDLLPMELCGPTQAFLTPGIVDVTSIKDRPDEEVFGPLLQVIRVTEFERAIDEANRTRFGLAAALFARDVSLYERFFMEVRAGVINFNRPTTGASGKLPFGGTGDSGNHRPAGSWSADYCSYPVASMETHSLVGPTPLTSSRG